MRVPWTLVKYNNDHKRVPWCSEGLKNAFFLEKVNPALQNLENPVRPNEGPWLGMDPVGAAFVSLESFDMIFDV